jgi:hypothetical protein
MDQLVVSKISVAERLRISCGQRQFSQPNNFTGSPAPHPVSCMRLVGPKNYLLTLKIYGHIIGQ